MSDPAQIIVEDVSHHYRPAVGREVLALDDVSLQVQEREFLALLGPSGCGKSTLLYLIGGFLPIGTGKILVDGKAVAGPGPDRGIVFQNFALFPWKTVRKNVLYGLERQALPRHERETRAQAFIDLVGLTGFEESYPSDAQTRSLMQGELLAIWEKTRKTVIFVTHDVHEAVYLAERVAVMTARPGRIKTIVDTRFDKDDPEVHRTRAFVDKVDEVWNPVRDEAVKALEKRPP